MVNKPLKSEVELCHYTGSLRGAKGSWAALSTCEGIEGVLYDGATIHHIARLEQPELASHLENPHYIYSEHHLKETNHTCGFHDTPAGHHDHEPTEVLPRPVSVSFLIRTSGFHSQAGTASPKVNCGCDRCSECRCECHCRLHV